MEEVPFYERGLFWGLASLAAAAVLTAAGFILPPTTFAKWLLVLAWILSIIPLWLAWNSLAYKAASFFLIIVCWTTLAFGLNSLWNMREISQPVATASTPKGPEPIKPLPSPPSLKALPSSGADNITEGIWFDLNLDASKKLFADFQSIDPQLLKDYNEHGSVNSIDNLAPEYYAKAWESTFYRLLICDAQNGIGSGITFTVSQHPYIFLTIANNPRGNTCVPQVTVYPPPMTGSNGFILAGESGYWPRLGYILDLPVFNKTFGLRIFLTGAELRQLAQGYSPTWKAFVIDDSKESLTLDINRKGGARWIPIANYNDFLPDRIAIKTDLLFGGPVITKEYRLVSTIPEQVGGSENGFIWALTWKRSSYNEGPPSTK